MKKWIILIGSCELFLFFLPSFVLAFATRPLELEYPEIGGITITDVAVGVPTYVKYIFYLAIAVSGFILFALLIYNGIRYLTSAGDPTKLGQAKKGILDSFLGVILLIASYLIFSNINPQLIRLEVKEIPKSRPGITPGFYVCNYSPEEISVALNKYITDDIDQRIEATNDLNKLINSPNTNQRCYRIGGSIPKLSSSELFYSYFIIPREEPYYDDQTQTTKYKYFSDFGVIFYSKMNYSGSFQVVFDYQSLTPSYTPVFGSIQISVYGKTLQPPQSILFFTKPPLIEQPGTLTLYNCYNKNQPAVCNGFSEANPAQECSIVLPVTAELNETDLTIEHQQCATNTRSLSISPPDSFIVILCNQKMTPPSTDLICNTFTGDIIDLDRFEINQCGERCAYNPQELYPTSRTAAECYPCTQIVYSIFGKQIK